MVAIHKLLSVTVSGLHQVPDTVQEQPVEVPAAEAKNVPSITPTIYTE